MNFNKNTDTCLRSTIEIDTREKIKISSLRLHLFLPEKINERKQISYRDVDIIFSIRKYSGRIAQFFDVIISILSMSIATQNPHRLSIFVCALKPDVVEGAFQNIKSGLFSF